MTTHKVNPALAELSRSELIEIIQQQGDGPIRIQFAGKSTASGIARKVRPRVMNPIKKYSAGTPDQQSRNLLIEGDNLQAMATLHRLRGQVDLVLTDPPYNTGIDFRYNDKWDKDPNDPGIGDFVSDTDGARHTKWMKFMWPRLHMMRSMLKPSGVLAICIDYRELFRLGQMLDEIFGESNRLGIINWQRSYTPTNDAEHVATTTEYVLVYAKDANAATSRLLPRTNDEQIRKNLDADSEPWTDAPATGSNAKAHRSMVYAIQSPFTGDLLYPPRGSSWRQGQDRNLEQLHGWGCKFKLELLDDVERRAEIIGVPVDEVPQVAAITLDQSFSSASKAAQQIYDSGVWPRLYFLSKGRGRPRVKKYLTEVQNGFVPTTFWADDGLDVPPLPQDAMSWPHRISGHSQQGVSELTDVVGAGHEFKTVKPLKLIKKILQIWSPPDGLIFDPFAGSATTGHAVWDLNGETDANRSFVLVEQGRPENGDSFARTLAADRLKRVATGAWKSGKRGPLPTGFEFVQLKKKVDAEALLAMERDEMTDTVIFSHHDTGVQGRSSLIRTPGEHKHLVARNADDEGFFLVWDGPDKNTGLNREVYAEIANEAKQAGLGRVYHVYARQQLYVTNSVRFYQIPDRILADFGLNPMSEPFLEDDL